MIKGVLFDFDGTIVDSEISRYKSIKAILSKYDISFTKKDWDLKFKSMGSVDIFEMFKKKLNLSWKSNEMYNKSHEIRYEIEKKEGVQIIKGFREFYDKLLSRGIKMLICSGGTTEHLKLVLNMLDLNSLDGFGREEYKNRKPAPDSFLEGLKRLGLNKREVIVFEDAKSGIEAANNAKLKVVAINFIEKEIEGLNVAFKFKNYNQIDVNEILK